MSAKRNDRFIVLVLVGMAIVLVLVGMATIGGIVGIAKPLAIAQYPTPKMRDESCRRNAAQIKSSIRDALMIDIGSTPSASERDAWLDLISARRKEHELQFVLCAVNKPYAHCWLMAERERDKTAQDRRQMKRDCWREFGDD